MNFENFAEKTQLTNAIIQDYYRLLFEQLGKMKRTKQKEEKDCSTKIVKFYGQKKAFFIIKLFLLLQEELVTTLGDLKAILNQHNKVMSDIKPLLKLMNKFGENKNLQKYTKVYYDFSENCQALVRYLTNEDMLQTRPTDVQEKITALKDLVPKIYTELSMLNEEENKCNSTNIQEHSDVKESSDEKRKLARISSKTGKVLQECNSYAVGVWKRVHQKLEGKDIDSEVSSSTQDQVSLIIYSNLI